MTNRLYHEDSYLRSFTGKVTGHDSTLNAFFLDQTAFYPGGGGQPADKGVISAEGKTLPLAGVTYTAGGIAHIIPQDYDLPPLDTAVQGDIDWDFRYALMRTHTALHVLCGVVFRDFGALVTGGNMTPLQGRMDFEFASLQKELVQVIEDAVNIEIGKSHPVSWREIPREQALKVPDLIRTKINLLPEQIKQIRVVEIQGLDLQADGGTHVRNTSEVKSVKITDYKSKGKENKRIYLELSA